MRWPVSTSPSRIGPPLHNIVGKLIDFDCTPTLWISDLVSLKSRGSRITTKSPFMLKGKKGGVKRTKAAARLVLHQAVLERHKIICKGTFYLLPMTYILWRKCPLSVIPPPLLLLTFYYLRNFTANLLILIIWSSPFFDKDDFPTTHRPGI